jgi:hypothetical protein
MKRIDFIKKKKYINWKYAKEGNPLITLLDKHLKKSRILNWVLEFLGFGITEKQRLNRQLISRNPNIPIKYILAHPEIPWDYFYVSGNPNLTLSIILTYHEKPWYWSMISQNPNITLEDILAHPELPWVWNCVSQNPNITLQDILTYPKLPWNWFHLSQNNSIATKDILAHPELGWNVIPKETVLYREILSPWDDDDDDFYEYKNPDINLNYILNHPQLLSLQDGYMISRNPKITLEDILSHPELNWEWNGVSRNPNLKPKHVFNNSKKPWHWNNISVNQFLWDDVVYKKNLKSDIMKRRNEIKKLSLFGHLDCLVSKYIGYV